MSCPGAYICDQISEGLLFIDKPCRPLGATDHLFIELLSFYKLNIFQERIRIGKELLEAKRIEEQNERKRLVFFPSVIFFPFLLFLFYLLYSLPVDRLLYHHLKHDRTAKT